MPLLAFRRFVLRFAGAALVALPSRRRLWPQIRQPSWSSSTAAQAIDIVKTTTPAPRGRAPSSRSCRPTSTCPTWRRSALGHALGQGHARAARLASSRRPRRPRPRPTASGSASMAARRSASARPRPGPTASSSSTAGSTRATASRSSSSGRSARSGQGLRITDVKVEGVSMVMTRRSDFNSYIQNNGGTVAAADR